MTSDVVCMALGNAPSGEQMSRFLAVGLADNTVRIISLDPDVSQPSFIYVFIVFEVKKLQKSQLTFTYLYKFFTIVRKTF